MTQVWERNEEQGEDDASVVETTVDDPSEVLEEWGEDVSSSPAQRGREGVSDEDGSEAVADAIIEDENADDEDEARG